MKALLFSFFFCFNVCFFVFCFSFKCRIEMKCGGWGGWGGRVGPGVTTVGKYRGYDEMKNEGEEKRAGEKRG